MILQTDHPRAPTRSLIYSPLAPVTVDIKVPKGVISIDFPRTRFAVKWNMNSSKLLLLSPVLGRRLAKSLELVFGQLEQLPRIPSVNVGAVALEQKLSFSLATRICR